MFKPNIKITGRLLLSSLALTGIAKRSLKNILKIYKIIFDILAVNNISAEQIIRTVVIN